MRATWRDAVLAESGDTVVIEGNHYFPADAINREYFRASSTHTHCPWKGEASYYDVVVEAAAAIRGRIAFWKGVRVA